jgi:hypothetical protein
MFSQETVVLDIDREQLDTGKIQLLVDLFRKLSQNPTAARAKRSAFMLSFENVGITNPSQDARSRQYIAKVIDAAPFVGYYLHGDAPFFHLRKISLALSYSESHGTFMTDLFLEAHHRLYNDAAAHGQALGDESNKSLIEEVFVVNLIHEFLHQDPLLQARAMRAMYPSLVATLSASPALLKLAFAEAERTWKRSVNEFESREGFLRAFEKTFKERLARR